MRRALVTVCVAGLLGLSSSPAEASGRWVPDDELHLPVGLNVGYAGGDGRDLKAEANGWRVRGLLSAVLITGYGGGGGLTVGRRTVDFWEVGVLLKVPLFSRTDGREEWGWGPYFG